MIDKSIGKKVINYIKHIYIRFKDDDVPALGAQITYYLILSIFPFLLFLLNVLSYAPINTNEIIQQITTILPGGTGDIVVDVVNETLNAKSTTLLSIGMITTIWMSSNGISAIIKGLNKAYDKGEDRPFWKVKGIALLFTIGLTLIILFALLMLIFGELIGNYIFGFLGVAEIFSMIWSIIRYLVPFLVMVFIFSMLYKYVPNHRIKFNEVIPGAVFSTLGWIITSQLFSIYVNNFGNYARVYGSLGGIIILLIWLYLSSMIILLGGEINATVVYMHKSRLRSGYNN